MANLVAISDQSAIDGFVRRIRRALWFNLLIDRLLLGLRLAAGLLLICGLSHTFIHALPISIGLVCVLLPLGHALLQANAQKPGISDAAGYADRHFNGKSLLATAVDLLHGGKQNDGDFSPLIIRQAAHSVTTWHRRLDQAPIRTTKPFPWWTLAVALLGIFMLLQAGKVPAPDFSESQKRQSDIPLSRPEAAETNRLLASIKKQESLAETAEDGQSEELADENHPRSQSDNYLQARQDADKAPTPNADQERLEADLNEQTHGSQGRQGIGNEADANPTTRRYPENRDMTVKWMATELDTGDRYSNAEIGAALAEHRVPSAEKSLHAKTTAAATRATPASVANLSFSQRHYIAAYFHQSRSQP